MNKINSIITKKNILIGSIILSIILLIPIIGVSFYTIPILDDFNYGTYTMGKLGKLDLLGLIIGAIKNLIFFYKTWQGTYSATIVFSLSPIIIDKSVYFITTFTILAVLMTGLYHFLKPILVKILKLDKTSFYLVLMIVFMTSIENLKSVFEGLYWWNGSTYYMVFFSLELMEFGLLLKRYYLKETEKKNYILLCLLTFIIGGGNFITALQQIIILFFTSLYLIYKEKDKSSICLLLIAIVGLGISAIAPGNSVRQAALTGMSAPSAIIHSFYYSIVTLKEWMNPFILLMILLIEICLYPSYQNDKHSFKYPLFWIGLMYCILSAMYTPSLFAQSGVGGDRIINIIYICNLFFLTTSLYILIGYIRNKVLEKKIFQKNAYEKILELIKENSFLLLIIGCILFAETFYYSRNDITSVISLRPLRNKEAQIFKKEWNERFEILEDKKIKKVEFEPLSVCPQAICNGDLSEDKDFWVNEIITEVYKKDYVIIKKKESDS